MSPTSSTPRSSWPAELDAAVGQHRARVRLRDVVAAARPSAGPRARPSSRRAARPATASMAAATAGSREEVADVGGDVGRRVDDVQRVVEDVEVVERRLLDVVQGVDLGQHGGQHAELVAERQRVDRVARQEQPAPGEACI